MRACAMAAAFWLRLARVLCVLAGALCCGGASMSVRMLREMATEEVGLTFAFVYYILVDESSWLGLRCLQRAFEWVCVSVFAVCG